MAIPDENGFPPNPEQKILFKEEVYEIIGAAYEVYNILGFGFLEAVYQEALEIELLERGIDFKSQVQLPIYYKNKKLNKVYIADILCYGNIILELKTSEDLTNEHKAQLLNYLRASDYPLGLLINFGQKQNIQWKRIIY